MTDVLGEQELLEVAETEIVEAPTEEEVVDAATEPTSGEILAALKKLEPKDKRPRAQPACQSPKKTKRGAKHGRKPRVRIGSGIRIVVVPTADTSAEEELLLLRALELLKTDHAQLNLAYVTRHPLVALMLKPKPWFLTEAHWHAFDGAGEIAGDDVLMEVGVPSHEEALEAEEAIYREKHEKLVKKLESEQRAAEESGVKDLKIDIPPYRFQARWHRGNGLLWKLQDDLGLPLNVPSDPVGPYNRLPGIQEGLIRKKLSKSRITDTPFAIYDFRDEEDTATLMQALSQALPDVRLISISEIEQAVGEGFLAMVACMSHIHCEWFIGGRLPALYAAWAGRVPGVVQIFRGEDPIWDGVHAEDNYIIQRDNISTEDLPGGIYSGIDYICYSTTR